MHRIDARRRTRPASSPGLKGWFFWMTSGEPVATRQQAALEPPRFQRLLNKGKLYARRRGASATDKSVLYTRSRNVSANHCARDRKKRHPDACCRLCSSRQECSDCEQASALVSVFSDRPILHPKTGDSRPNARRPFNRLFPNFYGENFVSGQPAPNRLENLYTAA